MAVPASIIAGVLANVAQRTSHPEAAAANEQARAACEALVQQLVGGSPLSIARALGAELIAEHGLSSLSSLPGDADWPGRFLDDPTEVFARAIALRLLKESAGKQGSEPGPACTPDPTGDAGTTVSFKVQLQGGSRRLGFAPEQGRWKLTHSSLRPNSGRSFLDGLESRRAPPQKWKPSLR